MCSCGTNRPARGAALVIVMLVMAVLLLAGTTFLTISSTESQIGLNERRTVQALALAEAGLDKALAQLGDNPSYPGETGTLVLETITGTFDVSVTAASTQVCPGNTAKDITVTGTIPVGGGQARAQIAATADQISYPYQWAAFATVPNGVIAGANRNIFGTDRTNSEIWIRLDSSVDSFDSALGQYSATSNSGTGGNIGGNASVYVGLRTQVKGNARAGGDITLLSGASVTETQVSNLSPGIDSPGESFPSVTPPSAPTLPICTDTSGTCNVLAGTYSIPAGTYSVNSLNIAGGSSSSPTTITPSGPVTIYVTGDFRADDPGPGDVVKLGNNVTLGSHPGTNLQIVLTSTTQSNDLVKFNTGNHVNFYGGLYGKNANVQFDDDAGIYGSIIGRTVITQQYGAVHFDQALSNREVCLGGGGYIIRRGTWREVMP